MEVKLYNPKQTLNKAFLKEGINRDDIELFKINFQTFFNNIGHSSDEEHLKSQLTYFLRDTWYQETHQINPIERNDLAIHNGKSVNDSIGVILEVKSISNKQEMMSKEKPNAKALRELVLYYLNDRIEKRNNQLKHLIVTNIEEWFLFDANEFDRKIFRNSAIKKLYDLKITDKKDNPFFYEELRRILDDEPIVLECTWFKISDYKEIVSKADRKDDKLLIPIYKLFSPSNLLKLPFSNDSNSLDKPFYEELLYLMGLEEVKNGNKKIITRKVNSNPASLLENTIMKLEDKDSLRYLSKANIYGISRGDQLFNVGLELCITWINRILFLKLLEAQLAKYHSKNNQFLFLNIQVIFDFDELNTLFFQVLAEKKISRRNHLMTKFNNIPYLNSSLFERTELERTTIDISALDNRMEIPIFGNTVLKDHHRKRRTGNLSILQYIFEFLEAYDFSSEGSGEIQEENKNLINASVLGLIFEKINGYKDGSFFTPGFITTYICNQTIRRSIVTKFKEHLNINFENYDHLKNYINGHFKPKEVLQFNSIINDLKICDPAVGSGHFLVSALNEIIAVKADLGILADNEGLRLGGYEFKVINDELIVTYNNNTEIFQYTVTGNKINSEIQRIQKTLFHEKELLIENCLFGVDINQNSVKICRLRLWIELLKNSYYTEESNFSDLETLPNIDINIKCGNSLINRFSLDSALSKALKGMKWNVETYRKLVNDYKVATNKDEKMELEAFIDKIKKDFRTHIGRYNKEQKKLDKWTKELHYKYKAKGLFADNFSTKQISDKSRLEKKIAEQQEMIKDVKNNKIYEGSFEWRFEFPEILNNDGDFIGFDIIIGNPPYGVKAKEEEKSYFKGNYEAILGKYDSYGFFIELGISIAKDNGQFAYIIPHTWLTVKEAITVRELILSKSEVLEIDQLPSNVFQDAVVETTNLFIQKKDEPVKEYDVRVLTFELDQPISSMTDYKSQAVIPLSSLFKEGVFNLKAGDIEDSILQKIKVGTSLLGQLYDLSVGVQAYDKYAGQTKDTIKNRIYHATLPKDPTFVEEFNGTDIKRYSINRPRNSFISYGVWLAHPRQKKYFDQKRLLVREITGKGRYKIIASKIDEYAINYKSVLNIIMDESKLDAPSLEFLLALLNSSLFSWIFLRTANKVITDTFPRISLHDLKGFPIKAPGKELAIEVAETVKEILSRKEKGDVDTSDLEFKLDSLVYKLYGVSDEERKVIENCL